MITEYNSLLKTASWFEKRKFILARDDNKCRCCGATKSLQVHHRQYHVNKQTGKKLSPWIYDNKYLITLCEKCHAAGHNKYNVPSFKI